MQPNNFFPRAGAAVYKERSDERGSGTAYFMHCDFEGAWVFFPEEPRVLSSSRWSHPCRGAWLAKSGRVDSYNILSTASAEWFVQAKDRNTGISARSVMWDFRIMEHIECVNGERYGPLCDLSTPCSEVTITSDTFAIPIERQRSFLLHTVEQTQDGVAWKSMNRTLDDIQQDASTPMDPLNYADYRVLHNSEPSDNLVLVYDRPIYYQRIGNLSKPNATVYALIMSSGRYYARFLVAIENKDITRTERSLLSDTSLLFQELMKHGWRQRCGYEYESQYRAPRWMCGYDDIDEIFERFVTHATSRYILLNPDTDTGTPIAMDWFYLGSEYLYNAEVAGGFVCKDEFSDPSDRTKLL